MSATDTAPEEDQEPEVVYIWAGGDPADGYYTSIPARDLTQEDFDALSDEAKAIVQSSELYQKAGGETEPAAEEAPAPAEAPAEEAPAEPAPEPEPPSS